MIMANINVSSLLNAYAFLLLFSVLLVCRPSSFVCGLDNVASHHVVSVNSLFPEQTCSESQDLGSSSLKVIHRHGPCSPMKQKKLSHEEILEQDQIRVDWVQSKASGSKTSQPESINHSLVAASKIPATSGKAFRTGNYIVTIGFGTPQLQQSVAFDTGSGVTWIQCQPCVKACYQQQQPLFDPSKSTTYKNISCSSPYCSALDISRCSGSTCFYSVKYLDNSHTSGFFAQDTLTLTSSDVIPNFRFGCGEHNNGFGTIAGLLGLDRENASLVSQTYSKYGGVFSYCLPASPSRTGYLTFGPAASASNVQYTPMLTDSYHPSFYFLELNDIGVGRQGLSLSPTLFSNAGVIIDSGTVITRLPPTAYTALRTAFRKQMTMYPLSRPASICDTCYDLSSYQTVTIPTVSFAFKGSTVNLDMCGIIYVASPTQACLAFAPNKDDTKTVIIGNTQQKTFNVVYDVSKKQIGFGARAC